MKIQGNRKASCANEIVRISIVTVSVSPNVIHGPNAISNEKMLVILSQN